MQKIPRETMMYLLFLFVGLPALTWGQINCSDNNGGCSHYCIDRVAMDGECGCDCYYQLGADARTCEPITECTVDMLWMFDFGKGILKSCPILSLSFLNPDTLPFLTYRDEVASYYWAFSSEILSGEYNVATVITHSTSGDSGLAKLNDYGAVASAGVLQSQITDIAAIATVICGDGNVFTGLYNSFDHSQVTTANPIVISGQGDPTTTTRVAVVAMVTPLDETTTTQSTRDSFAATIHGYYDQVFVIGKQDVSELGPQVQGFIQPQLRQLACNSTVASPCIYLFYADGVNDNGFTFTRNVVQPMIDRTACISRKAKKVHTATCNNYDITISIPSCLLGGMGRSDLQLNDPLCAGDNMAIVSGDNIVFTVGYDACSPVMTSNIIGDVEYVTLTQIVAPKDGVMGKPVIFGASCRFPRYTNEQLGVINPAVAQVSGFVEEVGSFRFELRLFENDSYTQYYDFSDGGLTVDVLQEMYFLARANLPGNMKLIVKDIIASSSTDKNQAPTHAILTNQCAMDDTFVFNSNTQTNATFQFQMFEFANTVNSPNAEKTPVYIHVTLHACDNSDTTPECTQACSPRKKRDSSAIERPIHSKTIGPFYVGPARSISSEITGDTVDERSKTTPEQIGFDPAKVELNLPPAAFRIYILAPGIGTMCLWFLLVVSTMVILVFVSKCILKLFPPKTLHYGSLDCKLTKGENKLMP